MNCSIGELIDKYSILELKSERITDQNKLECVLQEKNTILHEYPVLQTSTFPYVYYYTLLKYINGKIWDDTDWCKKYSTYESVKENMLEYAHKSYDIFDANQCRFRIKRYFNILCNSDLKEQKSYSEKQCGIDFTTIDNKKVIVDCVWKIQYIALSYDSIIFYVSKDDDIVWLQSLIPIPTAKYIVVTDNSVLSVSVTTMINLSSIHLTTEIKEIFMYPSIVYIAGGKLGDFIQQLSVICEKYMVTGRRGHLYISNTVGDVFSNGLENTYMDTKPFLLNQSYISGYDIDTNIISYEYDLSNWRRDSHELLGIASWTNIFNTYYGLSSWGETPWLEMQNNTKKKTILLNQTHYRPIASISFVKLYEYLCTKYLANGYTLHFITNDIYEYETFLKMHPEYATQMSCLIPVNFTEMCNEILSCTLFIGGLSAMLTIAHAGHISRIIGYQEEHIVDNNHNIGMGIPNEYVLHSVK